MNGFYGKSGDALLLINVTLGYLEATRTLAAAILALGLLLGSNARANANEVKVPITIDYVTLREALKHQVYTGTGGQASLWNGSDICQFLTARDPQFSRADSYVRLETGSDLSLGISMAGRCVSPLTWEGIVEVQTEPYIAPQLQLRLRVVNINLYNSAHEKTVVAGSGFDLIKGYLIPRIQTFTFDLNPSVNQLATLAEAASTQAVAERIRQAVVTLRAEPEVEVLDDGVRITLAITLPEFPAPLAAAMPSAPLTPQELAAFQKQLDDWDAFLVFAIKHLGASVGDEQFRRQLMRILLDSRY
ncbi:MAG TPA: hypothetical protein VIX12_10000, partial [Candidatus Binataceae bacterium]